MGKSLARLLGGTLLEKLGSEVLQRYASHNRNLVLAIQRNAAIRPLGDGGLMKRPAKLRNDPRRQLALGEAGGLENVVDIHAESITDSLTSVKTVSLGPASHNSRAGGPMTKRTFWDRLQEAMADNGLETDNLTAAAGLIGKHYTAATKWRDGGYASAKNMVELAEKLGVCVEWLYSERGPKRPGSDLPRDLGEMADFWEKLPLDVRAEIVGFAKYKRSTTFTGDQRQREEYQQSIARKERAKGDT